MKTFFSSFRNAFISILCAIVVLTAVGVGIAYAVEAQEKKVLDRNTALEYALTDAGVSESDITITRQKLNQENGKNCYEIEFFTDTYEYKYEIDAASGTVVGVSIEALFDRSAVLADNAGGNPDGNAEPEGVTPGQSSPQDGSGESDDQQSGQLPDSQPSGDQGGQSGNQPSDSQGGQSGNQPSGSQSGQSGNQPSGSQGGQSGNQPSGSQSGQSGDQPSDSQSGQSGNQTGQGSSQGGQISVDAAKEIAAGDAGVKLSDVTFTKNKLDLDDGIYVYEIEFYTASTEYEYEINAATGAIVDKSMETFQSHHSSGTSGGTGTSGSSGVSGGSGSSGASGSGSAYIGVDRAKEIAVGDAGVKLSDAIFTKSVLDLDDGVYMYEIEFYTTSAEYEYEINAVTGAVLDKDVEMFQTDGASETSGNAGTYIGVDRAKEIAVGHAGFGISDVVFTKAKVEREHGCSQYEIEFCKGTSEYEYCIDAFSGSILEYESGHCDHDEHGHHH